MGDQEHELPPMIQKAAELMAWKLALEEAGFSSLEAYGLLPPLMMTGVIRRDQP